MEAGDSKKKKRIITICLVIFMIIVGVLFAYNILFKGKEADFTENEILFFRGFVYWDNDPTQYEFKSLDAYYIEESDFSPNGMCYMRAQYTVYDEISEEWADIDKVKYGPLGSFDGYFCRNWDSLGEYSDINEEFEKAMEEGQHKSYTKEEIQDYIDKFTSGELE